MVACIGIVCCVDGGGINFWWVFWFSCMLSLGKIYDNVHIGEIQWSVQFLLGKSPYPAIAAMHGPHSPARLSDKACFDQIQ